MDSFELSAEFPIPPERLYNAWLDGDGHGDMTGAGASSDPKVGGRFTAWDGYISGVHLELEPYYRIVQAWRTLEFDDHVPDSRLEVRIESVQGGSRLTLRHSEIPQGQGPAYYQGWQDHYFAPMRAWLGV